jgi:hypothetical protein
MAKISQELMGLPELEEVDGEELDGQGMAIEMAKDVMGALNDGDPQRFLECLSDLIASLPERGEKED